MSKKAENTLTLLTELELDEVSGVDNPANPLSLVALWKKAPETQGDNDMNVEELTKRLEETETKLEGFEKRANDAETRLEALTKALSDAEITLVEKDGTITVEKAAEPEYIEIDGERVLKSEVPAPLLKRLEAAEKRVNDLVAKSEKAELTKRAETMFPNLGGTADEKAELVKMLDGLEGDAKTNLEKSLRAADAAVSKMFDEVGDSTVEESDAQKKLDAMVAKHADEKGLNPSVAYAEVTKSGEGRKLLLEIRKQAN